MSITYKLEIQYLPRGEDVLTQKANVEATGETVAEPARAPPAYRPPDFVPVPKAKQAEYGIAALRKKRRLLESTLGRFAAVMR